MNVDLGIWAKLTRVVIFLLFLAGILGVAVWYLPLIEHNQNTRKVIMDLDKRIQTEEEQKRQLKAAFDSLQRDPKAVERLARTRLGFAKPGEIVVNFESPSTNSMAPGEFHTDPAPPARRNGTDSQANPPTTPKPVSRLKP